MKKAKLLVFLVSQEWQVKKFALMANNCKNNNEILFLCSDLITKGNSFDYLKKINKFNYELIPNYNCNHILCSIKSTKFIINKIKSFFYQDFKNVIFISDNYSNIFASALRNIKFLYKSNLIFLQHGENHFHNQQFNYNKGWSHVNDVISNERKKILIDYLLLCTLCVYFGKISSFLKLNVNRINYRYDYLSFANKIIVSNHINKFNLIENGINHQLIYVIGSDLVDRQNSFKFNSNCYADSSKYSSAIIFTVGTYRKSLDENTRSNDKLFYSTINEVFDNLNLPLFFKLKSDEDFYFNKDFPDSKYFINNHEFEHYVIKTNKILYFVPVDSTLCLELSLLKIPYIAYTSWDSLSAIGSLNRKSDILILKNNINKDKLFTIINKVLNFNFPLNIITQNDLRLMLGSENESYIEKLNNLLS